MKKNPLVSVIIVNYNGKHHLEKCLPSLNAIDYTNVETILVDNNSTDGSIEFVEKSFSSIKITKLDKNYGFAEPNNIGAKIAKGEFILFLNNDTMVTSNFITELVKVINQDPKNVICQSLLLKSNGEVDSSGDFVDTLGRAYSSRNKTTEVKEILSARGASMLIRKKSFIELGGFDKNFFASFEDVDIGWRAWIWGYKVVLAPNSIVYHIGGQTTKNISAKVKFHGVKNSLILRMTNFEASLSIKSISKFLFVGFMRKNFGVSVISDPAKALPIPSYNLIFHGMWWVLKNLNYVLAKRKMVNSRRVRTTKELIEKGLITNY